MKWLDEFRDPALAEPLLERIRRAAAGLEQVTLMEVCGTHTMSIARFGLRSLMPDNLRLVSGPGCPVCVTEVGYVDHAVALARLDGVTITTFGDLVRVPGSSSSLEAERACGARVEVVTSPLAALDLAAAEPDREVIFLAVGFETTAPTVAATVLRAEAEGIANFSLLCAHKTVPVALDILVGTGALHGLLCPGHVSAVTGLDLYQPLAEQGVACAVAGFEPIDVLMGIAHLLEQLRDGEARVDNTYSRVVRDEGNPRARLLVERVFEPCDAAWRGIGEIPGSGLALRPALVARDAAHRFDVEIEAPREPEGCRCGDILAGKIRPQECPLYGKACTPADPHGACMVSSEGTCAAAYRYEGV